MPGILFKNMENLEFAMKLKKNWNFMSSQFVTTPNFFFLVFRQFNRVEISNNITA